MAQSAANSTMLERPQQTSSFLKLPIELRTMIYDFALQDVLDDLARTRKNQESTSTDESVRTLPYLGALAVLHTSHELRGESIDILRSLMKVKLNKLDEAASHARTKMVEMLSNLESGINLQSVEECRRHREAVSDGRRLRDTIRKLAYNQILLRLSRLQMELPWSTLGYEEKRWELVGFFIHLTVEDKGSLVGQFIGCGDIFDALVRFVDSGVEPHKKE